MKVLYIIDPIDTNTETITFYLNIFKKIQKFLPGKFFYSSLEYNKSVNEYYSDCFNNNLDENYNKKFKKELSFYESYELIITNSGNYIIREIFDFVINVTIGIYSRPPFNYSIQLDPWGMFWKSYTYNAPRLNIKKNYDLAFEFRKNLNLENQIKEFSLFAFNSEYWPLKIQNLPKTQVEYFYNFYKENSNVIWTKKPNVISFGINHNFDYEYFKNMPKENLVSMDSSLLIPKCKKIWVTHSSLGFQGALFGVEIESPSCFYYWKNEQIGTIGHLLETVWLSDFSKIENRIDKLKIKMPKNFKENTLNLYTYLNDNTNFYRI